MTDDGAALRFAVLGPVGATRDGTPVPLGPAKQRAVLAVLLLKPHRHASRDEIIDGVWGDDVPPSAPNLVATYVAGLRRALEPDRGRRHGATVLTSTTTGYGLCVRPEQVDAEVFERLVRAGLLDQALALWRGQPLAGLPGPFAAAERHRLDERHLTVLEQRIGISLETGEDVDRVAELTTLVAGHPYRERLRGLLMRALYLDGRQADALNAFRDARRALAHHLGIEPGPELRHLQHRILTGDPALLARRPAAPAAHRPSQLPADLGDFSGRDEELATVAGWLAGAAPARPPVVAVVTGPAGVGKTTLAVHAAHAVRDSFPDGQLFLDLRGADRHPLRAGDVLARFLRDLGVDPTRIPAPVDRRAALLRTVLTNRRVLIVLDDARHAAQVDPLLPGIGGSAVVVTSRARLDDLTGARTLGLGTLAADDARALLARIVGGDRVAPDPVATADVVAACAGLPLAVRIAGVRLAGRPAWTIRTLADRLRHEERRISELRAGGLAVGSSFQVSYTALPAPVRPVFRLLGVLDAPDVTAPVVAALTDRTVDDADRTLEQLVDAHLLESREPGRYQLHLLLRLYARERAGRENPPAERHDAVERAARHYLAGVRRADRQLRPGRVSCPDGYADAATAPDFTGYDDALAWLERERAAIVGVGLQAANTPGISPRIAATLAADLRAFLHRRGYWDDLDQLAGAAATAADRAGDDHSAALAHLELGGVAYLRQRYARADVELRRGLALFRRVDDAPGLSRALNLLSLNCVARHAYDEAMRLVVENLDVLRRLDDRGGESVALDNLALVEVRRGRPAEALGLCARSVALNRAVGSPLLACAALNILGLANSGLRRHARAAWFHRRSCGVARRAGNRHREAQALSDLAATLRATGRPARARACRKRARAVLRTAS